MAITDEKAESQVQYNSLNIEIPVKRVLENYFFSDSVEEVEEIIRQHSEDTFAHFVVAKKTKGYGAAVTTIDIRSKFRIHWQSRDLTSTEECAVQIPFEGIPFIYLGEKTYMCHHGRNKAKIKGGIKSNTFESDTTQNRSRTSKKQVCTAKIFIKEIARFPEYRIPCHSEYLRTQMSQKLRKAIMNSKGSIEHVVQFIGTLPDISDHCNHDIGVNKPIKEPIDHMIREKIMELLWRFGEHTVPKKIKELLDQFVCKLFEGKEMPANHRRKFYPNEKDIANYMYKSRLLSKINVTEKQLMYELVDELKAEYSNDKFLFHVETDNQCPISNDFNNKTTKDNKNNLQLSNEQKFFFAYQSSFQQGYISLYGKQAILTGISETLPHLPFPCYGVFVPTNVDYQLVYCFIVQSSKLDYLRQGLAPLLEWNPSWSPKFFTVDFSIEQINIIEEMFPSCSVMISDSSREETWNTKMEEMATSANTEHILSLLSEIANSYTEETLNQAAQQLENSEEWRMCESLRDWFSADWLAEAKRWVAGYRHDEYLKTLHVERKLSEEISTLRPNHSTFLRTRKIIDFISYIVKVYTPDSRSRYVEKNISDYRTQYFRRNTHKTLPPCLCEKTDSFTNRILQRIEAVRTLRYTVNQVQTGILWLFDEAGPGTTYTVALGNDTTLPSCVCIDWLKYKLPCDHIVFALEKIEGLNWDVLSKLYSLNPIYNIDMSCMDKEQEDKLLTTWVKGYNVELGVEPANELTLSDSKDKQGSEDTNSSKINISKTNSVPSVTGPLNYLNFTTSLDSVTLKCNSVNTVKSLVLENSTLCQELANNVSKMDDNDELQKIKVDIENILSNIQLKLSKNAPPLKVSYSENNSLANEQSISLSNDTDYVQVLSMPNQTKPFTQKDLVSDHFASTSFLSKLIKGENIEKDDDVWIYDPELNIKLMKEDRHSILCGRPLSLEIMKTVQNILKHQFRDIDGLGDLQQLNLENIQLDGGTFTKKSLQLHLPDEQHCLAFARSAQHILQIFCCSLSSKAAIMEQILNIGSNNSLGDNIFIIERIENLTAINNCGLYAIAYSVAFLFDIETTNFVFEEGEMRSHLAECLEDMCFSMFPVRNL